MSVASLKNSIPDEAKDIRLNLSSVLTEEGAPGLNKNQIWGVALSCAYASFDKKLVEEILEEASEVLSEEEKKACRSAVSIMAMNNVYYRSVHLSEDPTISKLPAGLRMNVLSQSGIDKKDFEMYSLGVSAINGCGLCIKSHSMQLKKHGVSDQGIQSVFRVASVIQATKQSLFI